MIHETAVIDKSAKIGANVEVGAYSIIGPDVVIGDNCWIGPHAVINGPTILGKHNKVFQFASIGEQCQGFKYNGEPTQLIVGDHNTFREFTTIQRGTVQDNGKTIIGSHCLFIASIRM